MVLTKLKKEACTYIVYLTAIDSRKGRRSSFLDPYIRSPRTKMVRVENNCRI